MSLQELDNLVGYLTGCLAIIFVTYKTIKYRKQAKEGTLK